MGPGQPKLGPGGSRDLRNWILDGLEGGLEGLGSSGWPSWSSKSWFGRHLGATWQLREAPGGVPGGFGTRWDAPGDAPEGPGRPWEAAREHLHSEKCNLPKSLFFHKKIDDFEGLERAKSLPLSDSAGFERMGSSEPR